MLEKIKAIREKLLFGVRASDLLYITMQINNLDTLIYHETERLRQDETPIEAVGYCPGCGVEFHMRKDKQSSHIEVLNRRTIIYKSKL
jgi:hypothetical protein